MKPSETLTLTVDIEALMAISSVRLVARSGVGVLKP